MFLVKHIQKIFTSFSRISKELDGLNETKYLRMDQVKFVENSL